jgi:uncharacterized protein (TIGR03437 family)
MMGKYSFLVLFAECFFLNAQPGSVATHALQTFGPAVIDAGGNVYTIGIGIGGPVTPGALQTQPGGGICGTNSGFPGPQPCTDAYVAKSDAMGNLVFGTWLGGSGDDEGGALAVDSAGAVYMAGSTTGSFPTTPNAAIPISTSSTGFVAKLSADGSKLIYSTYLPSTIAGASAIAVDAQGNVSLVGKTTTGHAFVAKLSADGSTFLYTTIFAGTNKESATAVAIDPAGNAVAVGYTLSADFPVSSSAVQAHLSGTESAFVAKLDPAGNIVFSTYLGGTGADNATAVQTDSAGNIYVAGVATSLDFPTTPGTFQPNPLVPLWNVWPGGFLAKLTPDGKTLAYSTYVMSSDIALYPGVTSLAVSAVGEVYVAGVTGASFPVTASAPQQCFGGRTDVFVAHLNVQGVLLDATYIGGTYDDAASALGLSADGSVLLVWGGGGSFLSRIVFGGPGWSAPACLSPDVLNSAGLYSRGYVSPGEFVSLTGLGIGPQTGVAYQPGAQGQAPVALYGVKVFFDGQQAPLTYVQSRQVNALAPFELSPGATTAITLEYNGAMFGPVYLPVSSAEPDFFRLQPNVSAQALAVNQDGTFNGPSNPASAGSVVAFWGTGFGPTDPACPTGALNAPTPVNLAPGTSFRFNGPVEYIGGAPTLLCGVVQINMQIPAQTPPGTLLLSLNGAFAQSTVFVK